MREQIHNDIIYSLHTQKYRELDLDIINNSPREILDSVCELGARLDGSWEAREEDEELQKRFWSIMREWDRYGMHHDEVNAQVCTAFLRKNHEWFLS